MKLLLEDYPNLFDRLEVLRVGRLFVGLNVLLLKPFSNSWCNMYQIIVLLKCSIAGGVNLLRDQEDNCKVLRAFPPPIRPSLPSPPCLPSPLGCPQWSP